MPRTYACRRCGTTHSLKEYEQSRFCRSCGTYLTSENMVSKLRKTVVEAVKGRVRGKASEERWLPEGYEVREGQMEFIEEASNAIKS